MIEMIRDAVDAVDVCLDCMQSLTLQCVQSLVSISRLILTNGGGFRDLTIPCENFSLPPTSLTTTTRSYRTLCDVFALALGQRPRFVAVTTYRCRVRFRRPKLYIASLVLLIYNNPKIIKE